MNFQKATAVLLSALTVCFLSGCDMSIEFAVSSKSQSNSALSNSNNDSPTTISEPSATVVPNASISDSDISKSADLTSSDSAATEKSESTGKQIDDTTKEYSDLSFLSESQQELYRAAYDTKDGLYGIGGNLMYLWGYRPVLDSDNNITYVDDKYVLYDVSYCEFSNRIHQIFTDNYLSSTDYAVKFIDYHGKTAVDYSLESDMVEGTTIQVNEAFPDTYRLVNSTENTVMFTLISHYDRNGWDDKKDFVDVYTIEYPIRMKKTDTGWIIDEFHTTRFG